MRDTVGFAANCFGGRRIANFAGSRPLTFWGLRPRPSRRTVRLDIPRANVFSVTAVRELIDRLDRGDVS
jgi:hypothetical protein